MVHTTAKTIIHSTHKHHTALDKLFRYAEFLNFGEIHIKFDHATGLRAIVAVHNLKRGPALGGCRLMTYPSTDEALQDAMRLAYMMSYKAAISDIPHGGAKAVLLKPKVIQDRHAYFSAFGDFVNSLGGCYITAVDSGTSPQDMDIIAKRTPFVACTTSTGNDGDPSPPTALGVRRGIEAAVKFKLGKDSLAGIHVTVQGTGHVGYILIKELTTLGARVTACDINPHSLERCVAEFGIETCATEDIYSIKADVFAPCALGSVLNADTIKRLQVSIVAGSANNQFAHHHQSITLQEKGILYCPDFVINAGGLIYASAMYQHADINIAFDKVKNIYDTLMSVFQRAQQENRTTNEIAEIIAIERLR